MPSSRKDRNNPSGLSRVIQVNEPTVREAAKTSGRAGQDSTSNLQDDSPAKAEIFDWTSRPKEALVVGTDETD